MQTTASFSNRGKTHTFSIEMLSMDIVLEDYEAVLESRDDIVGVFGPSSTWPQADLTIRQNLLDLAWHEKEFQKKSSFAYVVRNATSGLYIGCLYIYESKHPEYDAECIYWIRTAQKHMFSVFESELHEWIRDILGVQKPAYPGKVMSWDVYNSLS